MTLTSVIQHNLLQELRLQYIRAHQNAFDVESIFPLQLFEEFVVGVRDNCIIDASCKVEGDKLTASRFILAFEEPAQHWVEAISFFRQVEQRVDVNLNYNLLRNFIGNNFDFSKMTELDMGITTRTNLADSSLKMHIGIKNYPEKITTALALADFPGLGELETQLLRVLLHQGYFIFKKHLIW